MQTRTYLFSFFLIITIGLSFAKATASLSNEADVSVITCGPWQGELYSAFGHSAFRVYDPSQGIDVAYNYGVFDFNQPNFYLNFARGFLYYQLGLYDYPDFRAHYIYHNRYVHEQVLNLTQAQKQKMYDFLQWNAEPENQQYRYDYFYNNCATKMRDVLVEVLGSSISFDGSYIKTDYTIRDLTDVYLQDQPWGDLGIDICLGLPMDKKASPYEYMFIPDYVESGLDHAVIKDGTVTQPLVKETVSVYESRAEDLPPHLPHPLYFSCGLLLLALIISAFDWRRKKASAWLDVILFGASGLIGLLLLFLWVATDHKAAAANFNLLWAFPPHVIIIFVLNNRSKVVKNYFGFTAILLLAVLLMWNWLPQQLNYSLVPVVVSLALRAALRYVLRSPESSM